jgi:hypothetical protein
MNSKGSILLCLLGASLAGPLAGCEDTATALKKGAKPEIVLSDVRLETYGPDGMTSVTTAREVVYRRDTGELEGDTVVLDLPPSERVGRGGVVMAAPRARGDVKQRAAFADGGVSAVTGQGDKAFTAHADYRGDLGTVSGDTPVHVEGPAYTLDAGGYVFHVGEDRLELVEGVRARSTPGQASGVGGAR